MFNKRHVTFQLPLYANLDLGELPGDVAFLILLCLIANRCYDICQCIVLQPKIQKCPVSVIHSFVANI